MTGVPEADGGRRCPECGREIGSERELWRTKPRWGLVACGVVAITAGAGLVRYGAGERGAVGLLPNWVVIRMLPEAEGSDQRRDQTWVEREMAVRVLQDEVSVDEVVGALVRVGAVRTAPKWPEGAVIAATITRVRWMDWLPHVKTERIGPAGMQTVSGVGDDQDLTVSARYVEVALAQAGMTEVGVEMGFRAWPRSPVKYARAVLPCRVVAAWSPEPDRAEATTAAVREALVWNGVAGDRRAARGREMLWTSGRAERGVKRLTLQLDEFAMDPGRDFAVEIEVDVDRGAGWEAFGYVPGYDVEPAAREREEPDGRRVKVGQVMMLGHGWPRGIARAGTPEGMAPVAAWKFRLRGVKPSGVVLWPRARYWAGEFVVTREDVVGGW